MRKTAEMSKKRFPKASETIIKNSYMDDIIESVHNMKSAKKLTTEIEDLLKEGGLQNERVEILF